MSCHHLSTSSNKGLSFPHEAKFLSLIMNLEEKKNGFLCKNDASMNGNIGRNMRWSCIEHYTTLKKFMTTSEGFPFRNPQAICSKYHKLIICQIFH